MLSVLANRTYRHLFAAQVIALIGTGLLTVASGLLAFRLAERVRSSLDPRSFAARPSFREGRRAPSDRPNA
jgi:hypothetical protein